MKILTLCNYGRNRSQYLAKYLKQKGHETSFAGVLEGGPNEVTQAEIDWAELIVVATSPIGDELEKRFGEAMLSLSYDHDSVRLLFDALVQGNVVDLTRDA